MHPGERSNTPAHLAGLPLVADGGLLYTGGILFCADDTRWRHAHGVWHLFVMAGASCRHMAVPLHVG